MPSTSGYHTLACLPLWRATYNSQLTHLWYLLGCDHLFCELSRVQSVALEPSHGMVLCFSLFLSWSHNLGFPLFSKLCQSHLFHQSVLKEFNSGPFPKDRWHSPHLSTHSPVMADRCEHVNNFLAGNCDLAWFLWSLLFIYLFFRLCFPLRFLSSPLTPSVGVFPVVWKFLLLHDAIPRMGHCPQIYCLSFCLYLSSYLIPKRLLCLSGYLVSSSSVQKLFCGSCSTCRWSFDVFVKEKMVSQSYSFTILDHSSGLVLLSVWCKFLHPGFWVFFFFWFFCFFFIFCMDYLFAFPHFQSFFFCLYI